VVIAVVNNSADRTMSPVHSPWLYAGRDRPEFEIRWEEDPLDRQVHDLFSHTWEIGDTYYLAPFWGKELDFDTQKEVFEFARRLQCVMPRHPRVVKYLKDGSPRISLEIPGMKRTDVSLDFNHQGIMVLERIFDTRFPVEGSESEYYADRRDHFPWKDFPPEAQACPELWFEYTEPPNFLPKFGRDKPTDEPVGCNDDESVVSTDDISNEIEIDLEQSRLKISGPQFLLENLQKQDITGDTMVTVGGSIPLSRLPPGVVNLRAIAYRRPLPCKFRDTIFELIEADKDLKKAIETENLKDPIIAAAYIGNDDFDEPELGPDTKKGTDPSKKEAG